MNQNTADGIAIDLTVLEIEALRMLMRFRFISNIFLAVSSFRHDTTISDFGLTLSIVKYDDAYREDDLGLVMMQERVLDTKDGTPKPFFFSQEALNTYQRLISMGIENKAPSSEAFQEAMDQYITPHLSVLREKFGVPPAGPTTTSTVVPNIPPAQGRN